MMDDEIVIGIEHPENEMPKKKKKKATKKVASKKANNEDKTNKSKKRKESKENKERKKMKERKTQKVKSKKPLIIIIIVLLPIGIFAFLLFSSFFKIKNIELKNNSRVTLEEIENLGNFNSYRNIFWVHGFKVSKDLQQNAYIENVKIHRKLPNTLVIDIKERIPKFMLQIADSYVYINSQGYLLKVSTENIGLPIILGFKTDLSNVELGKRLDVEDLKRMDTIIKIVENATAHDIDNLITKIDISEERNYTLILETDGKTVYLGDATNLNTRMIYLSGILSREKGVPGEIFLNMNLNTEDAFFREKI